MCCIILQVTLTQKASQTRNGQILLGMVSGIPVQTCDFRKIETRKANFRFMLKKYPAFTG